MLFTITFILFAIVCMAAVYLDAKIKQHIFVNHPKLWKSFGYSSGFQWFVPAVKEKFEFAIADFQLADFLKSPKCEALGDVELLRLKALNQSIQKMAIFTALSLLVTGLLRT